MGGHAGPRVTAELAQAVNRLGYLRRQLKELETEESLLRDSILSEIQDWPRDSFPVKVGSFEVRLGQRQGRLKTAVAMSLLADDHLLAELPLEPAIRDAAHIDKLGQALSRLAMPDATRSLLVDHYKASVEWRPVITQETLKELADRARITPEQYRSCFKDGQPVALTLVVR